MAKPRAYWIKERHNPQLKVYYVACGQITKAEAAVKERSMYGFNVMHRFETEMAYLAKLEELRKAGTLQQ